MGWWHAARPAEPAGPDGGRHPGPNRGVLTRASGRDGSPEVTVILTPRNRGPTRLSVTRDMSGFGSTRSVRFVPEGSHAAGGQNGPDHRCDWIASEEEVELRGGWSAAGDERAAFPPPARCL